MILKGKGGKDRIVPATSALVQSVNELALLDGVNEPDYLWYCRPGGGSMISRSRPIVDSAFARWWTRCLEEAGVPYRNPHVARHTFATRWLRKGGRLDLLSMAMGHASIKTTHDLYSHLDTTDLAAEFAQLFPRANLVQTTREISLYCLTEMTCKSAQRGADQNRTGVCDLSADPVCTRPES